jgi:hypothetical protein
MDSMAITLSMLVDPILLLQVIQRMGHWLLDAFGTAYIVPGFTAEALLALGFWPGAAQKDFSGYWAERFACAVPEQLVQFLMPGLNAIEQEAAAAVAAGKPSNVADHYIRMLRTCAVVVVTDALELAEKYPDNPVHKELLQHPTFRYISLKMLMSTASNCVQSDTMHTM